RKQTRAGRGCVGARVLPEIPEPPGRLSKSFLERRELGRSGQILRFSEKVTFPPDVLFFLHFGAAEMPPLSFFRSERTFSLEKEFYAKEFATDRRIPSRRYRRHVRQGPRFLL